MTAIDILKILEKEVCVIIGYDKSLYAEISLYTDVFNGQSYEVRIDKDKKDTLLNLLKEVMKTYKEIKK